MDRGGGASRRTRRARAGTALAGLSLLAGLVMAGPASAQTSDPTPSTSGALSPGGASALPAVSPGCAAAAGRAAATAAATEPELGWADWWTTSELARLRSAPACWSAQGPLVEPRWRAQLSLHLATSRPELAPLGAWLAASSTPRARVANPAATIVDAAAGSAMATTPGCALPPSLVASVLWVIDPGLLRGDVVLTADGGWSAAVPAGLPQLWAALGVPVDPTAPSPPSLAVTSARLSTWLCARGSDLSTPEGRTAALTALLRDPATVAVASATADLLGPARLDARAVIAAPRGAMALTRVRGMSVSAAVAPHLDRLIADAAEDGVVLTGGGYRSAADQIARRRANCAGPDGVADDYDIYEKPSLECSPPTARPGTSMHESGEAIDFERCQTRGTECFRWLSRYAHRYGLYNYPVEPWHWSTTGQ